MRAVLAAALAVSCSLAAAPAQAAAIAFRGKLAPNEPRLYSADGYHVAYYTQEGTGDALKSTWYVDHRKVALFAGQDVVYGKDGPPEAALSPDGSRLAVDVIVRDRAGRPLGEAVHVNGAQGVLVNKINSVGFGGAAAGRLWFTGQTASGWSLYVDDKPGPAFAAEPSPPKFNAAGGHFAYTASYSDGYHVLLDHEPAGRWPGPKIFFSKNWAARAGTAQDPSGWRVFLGPRREGPLPYEPEVRFSDDGARWAAFVPFGSPLLVDGKASPLSGRVSQVFFDGANAAYWVAGSTVFREGTAIDSGWEMLHGLAVSPGGSRFAYVASRSGEPAALVVNAEPVLKNVAVPGLDLVFDDENELHWVSVEYGVAWLNCVVIGKPVSRSKCARKARQMGLKSEGE